MRTESQSLYILQINLCENERLHWTHALVIPQRTSLYLSLEISYFCSSYLYYHFLSKPLSYIFYNKIRYNRRSVKILNACIMSRYHILLNVSYLLYPLMKFIPVTTTARSGQSTVWFTLCRYPLCQPPVDSNSLLLILHNSCNDT